MYTNLKIVISALGVSLWYNASARMFDLIIPQIGWKSTVFMFFIATAILLYDDGVLSELGSLGTNGEIIPIAARVGGLPHASKTNSHGYTSDSQY